MLGQSVEHVVEEANACADADSLRFARLGSVVARVAHLQAGVGVWGECAAIEVEGDLDFGLVGVARKGRPPGCRV